MTVPVQYFQVAAAAIPTLLIAAAISARTGERVHNPGGTSHQKALAFIALMMLSVAISAGELCALIALATRHGTVIEAVLSFCALWLTFEVVLTLLLMPLLDSFTDRFRTSAVVVFGVFFGSLPVGLFIGAVI